jgi:hypothetical protein
MQFSSSNEDEEKLCVFGFMALADSSTGARC